MKEKDFNARVSEICAFIDNAELDNLKLELKKFVAQYGAQGVFAYGAWCEKNFEANLREDYKRKTTYTSDFSIAEWCVAIEGNYAISNTFKSAMDNWKDNIEFFAEIIIVLNMKSWEHHARKNMNYSQMYSELYYMAKDLYFDWFDEEHPKHDEAMQYYFDYVD